MDHRTGSVSPRNIGAGKRSAGSGKASKRIGRLRLDSAGHANKIFRYANKEKDEIL